MWLADRVVGATAPVRPSKSIYSNVNMSRRGEPTRTTAAKFCGRRDVANDRFERKGPPVPRPA